MVVPQLGDLVPGLEVALQKLQAAENGKRKKPHITEARKQVEHLLASIKHNEARAPFTVLVISGKQGGRRQPSGAGDVRDRGPREPPARLGEQPDAGTVSCPRIIKVRFLRGPEEGTGRDLRRITVRFFRPWWKVWAPKQQDVDYVGMMGVWLDPENNRAPGWLAVKLRRAWEADKERDRQWTP